VKADMKLSQPQKRELRRLEIELQACVKSANSEKAAEITAHIQTLFGDDRRHHRLLRAKLWCFEAALDANSLGYAESGLLGVRNLAGRGTRLQLEASTLLAVCYLRQKRYTDAKKLIRGVVSHLAKIQSNSKRRQFQKRLVERIEEECILAELIGVQEGVIIPEEVHAKAVLLIQRSSDNEIFALLGNSIPSAALLVLNDVRDYSINLIAATDRKLLPAPAIAERPENVGKKAFAVLRRIAWKTFCSPDSELYKMWSKKIPAVFNKGYFAAAITATMAHWRIGIPLLASGVVALAMKYSAQEFCKLATPKSLMIDPKDMAN